MIHWKDLILMRKKTSKKFLSAFEQLTKGCQADLEAQTIAFKRFSCECSRAGINTQPLIRLLSTIYGQIMVERGYVAILKDRISSEPIMLSREILTDYCQWILDENHLTDWILMSAQDGLETKSIEPASDFLSNGD